MTVQILETNIGHDARGRPYMQRKQLVKAADGLTESYADFVTDKIPVRRFGTAVFIFQFAFADADSIQVAIETSEDEGATWSPWPDQGIGSAGVYTQKPRVDSFLVTDEAVAVSPGAAVVLGTKTGANMNSTSDQAIALDDVDLVENPEFAIFQITQIEASNPSTSLDTAVGGVYPAASKGGTAIVANTQVYSSLVNPEDTLDLTLAADANAVWGNVYLSLTTPQGATATADFSVSGVPAPTHELAFELDNVMYIRAKVKHTGGTDNLPAAQVFFMGGR